MVCTQSWYGSCFSEMGNFIPQWDTIHRCVHVLHLYWNDSTGGTQETAVPACSSLLLSVCRSFFPQHPPGDPFLTGTSPSSAETSQKFMTLSLGHLVLHILLVQAQGHIHISLWTSLFLSWLFVTHNWLPGFWQSSCQRDLPMFPLCLALPAQIAAQTCLALVFSSKDAFGLRLEQARTLTKLVCHEEGKSFPLAEAELLCRKMLFPTKLSL